MLRDLEEFERSGGKEAVRKQLREEFVRRSGAAAPLQDPPIWPPGWNAGTMLRVIGKEAPRTGVLLPFARCDKTEEEAARGILLRWRQPVVDALR
jgi:hypothetical protein